MSHRGIKRVQRAASHHVTATVCQRIAGDSAPQQMKNLGRPVSSMDAGATEFDDLMRIVHKGRS